MVSMKNGVTVATTCAMGFHGRGNPVKHFPQSYPHSLLVGKTGSGKSYAARSWLYNFLECYPKTKLTMLDLKGEFCNFSGTRYYQGVQCYEGLKAFGEEMIKRQNDSLIPKTPMLLYIDELAATVNLLEKKQADEFRRMLSVIYMLSRAQNMFTISSVQRADASTWVSGARDNIGLVLLLGELSKESCEMFSLDKSMLSACPYPGMGHILINGSPESLIKVRTPVISNLAKVETRIIAALD